MFHTRNLWRYHSSHEQVVERTSELEIAPLAMPFQGLPQGLAKPSEAPEHAPPAASRSDSFWNLPPNIQTLAAVPGHNAQAPSRPAASAADRPGAAAGAELLNGAPSRSREAAAAPGAPETISTSTALSTVDWPGLHKCGK